MKLTIETYNKIKSGMNSVMTNTNKALYKSKGLSKARYARDIFINTIPLDMQSNELYIYMNDCDIESAILNMVGEY